jgi:hypothetical protein
MDAGRELDALVAEKVMGWMRVNSPHKITGANGEPSGLEPIGGGYATFAVVPHYSTDIAAAWQIVEMMERRGYWCQMRTPFQAGDGGDGFWAGFTPHGTSGWNGRPDHWTDATILPLAICLAALRAVGALP